MVPVDADDEASCDFWIESTGVTGLFNSEDSLNPGDDFMRTGIGRFAQIDASVLQVFLQWPFEGCRSGWDGGVMISKNIHFVIVLEEKGPVGTVQRRILI